MSAQPLESSGDEQVSAVVINHNAGDALLGCVASLRRCGLQEIVVVDNASSDGSLVRLAEADPQVILLPTGKNLGYGAAANLGVHRTGGSFVLICNPDLEVDENTPAELRRVLLDHEDAAVAGPRIVQQDGETYRSGRAFPSLTDGMGHAFVGLFNPENRWTKRYRAEGSDVGPDREVDWVSGACMLVRRIAFLSVGGFDARYFMYVEDLDLCWRLRRGAWKTRYVPEVSVVHEQGVSSKDHPYRLLVAHHESTWRFVRRSVTGRERALLPVMGLGIGVRLLLAVSRTVRGQQRAKANLPGAAVG